MLIPLRSTHVRAGVERRRPGGIGWHAIRFAAAAILIVGCGVVTACSASSESELGHAGEGPECDPSVVLCRSLPPVCPAGHVPAIAGTCWAGYCVKASTCRSVKDCASCSSDGDVCVTYVPHAYGLVRCVEVPPACADDRTCGCLRSYICSVSAFRECSGDGSVFMCECPNC